MAPLDKPLKSILKEKTVFILGAGASNPYGFPLGQGLKQLIKSSAQGLSSSLLTIFGYSKKLIRRFVKTLNYAVYPTIDIFLENKPRFRGLGSACIAHIIMSHELEHKLFPQKNWYGSIFDVFELGTNSVNLKNLSVLTFNYDRSFEHFITDNINYNCRQNLEKNALKEVKKIKLIHLHGSIGEYPVVPYGTKPTVIDRWIEASKNIKIISDKIEDSAAFIEGQKEIQNASNIIFLGFGYDLLTLQKLLMELKIDDKNIIGSAMGINEDYKLELLDYFGNNIILGQNQHDCDAFLRQNNIIK